MMICMSIVVILFAILMIAASAEAFCEAPPRDMRDAMCFLVMLVVCVAIVLVFVVKGF